MIRRLQDLIVGWGLSFHPPIGPLAAGILMLLLAVLFGFLGMRVRRTGRAVERWFGLAVSALVALFLASVAVVDLRGIAIVKATHSNPIGTLTVAGTKEQIARGEKLAHLCSACHTSTYPRRLPLDGQEEVSPLGFYAPNLTPGGILKDESDGQLIRAIREGVDKNGRTLLFMPSEVFQKFSDADVLSIVAYMRSQPAVTRPTPPRNLSIFGTILVGLDLLPTQAQAPIREPVVAPAAGITPEYGRYLSEISGCVSCHGKDLSGGASGFPLDWPPVGPSLTLIVSTWSEADFIRTFRTSIDPKGKTLAAEEMPAVLYSQAFSDDELKALYAYIRGLKPSTPVAK